MPNADTEGREIRALIQSFCSEVANAHYFESMGQHLYLSTMAQVDAVVGNSSSGLLEAPAMGVGTLNIGTRQNGRQKPDTVIDWVGQGESLKKVLDKLVRAKTKLPRNGVGQEKIATASQSIVASIEHQNLHRVVNKMFRDSIALLADEDGSDAGLGDT